MDERLVRRGCLRRRILQGHPQLCRQGRRQIYLVSDFGYARSPSSCTAPATNQPDGQNLAFAVGQIIFRTHAILSPRKGRWPSSPNVGMGCGGRGGIGREVCSQGGFRERATARRTYDAEAYGEVVWF